MKKIKYVLLVFSLLFVNILNVSATTKVSCGNITGIPAKIPELTSFAVNLIQVAIPIILVLIGSIDLFKGIAASKEDEIKKGQQLLIKRLMVAAVIFFIVAIVKVLVSLISNSTDTNNIVECIDCFVSNQCRDVSNRIVCEVENYELYYNTDGSFFGWRDANSSSGMNFAKSKDVSKFSPTTTSECPTDSNADVMFNGDQIIIRQK